VESIPELRKICQTAFKKERADFLRSNLYGHFVRLWSIYITRLVLPAGVSANQVTLMMIVTGVTATGFFCLPSRGTFLLGALLMQLWYTLDGVDGEVARYRHYQKTGALVMDKRDGGLTGMYFDMINHYIINLLLPLTAAFGLFWKTGSSVWMLIGILASLGQVLMLAVYDARCRTQLTHIKRFAWAEIIKETEKVPSEKKEKGRNPLRVALAILHNTLTYPAVMNLTGLSALLNFIFPAVEWRVYLLLYLSFGSAIVTGTFVARAILQKTNEEEIRASFRLSDEVKAERPAEV